MKKMIAKIVLQLFFPILVLSQDKPTICLEQGACFEGSWIDSTSTSTKFASFQGIRYAQPPIGELRFKSPQPYVYEDGKVIDVSEEFNVTCPQLGGLLACSFCLSRSTFKPTVYK